MRLWPKTSFNRTFVIIGTVLLLTQLLSLFFVAYFLYVPGIRQYAHIVGIQLDSIHRILEKEPEAEVINVSSGVRVWKQQQTSQKGTRAFILPLLEGALEEELGEPVEMHFRYNEQPLLWVRAESLGNRWVEIPMKGLGRYDFWIVVAWIIGSPVLAIIATWLSVRQINRPLKRLQTAARQIGRGEPEFVEYHRRDTEEIRAVNQAFNQMVADIRQSTQDRALLLAGVSHDLRTPLTRMRLTAELLGAVDPELTQGMIHDIEDMDAILDQFISFIRDGSDEMPEMGDLNDLIQEVAKQYEQEVEIYVTLRKIPKINFKRLAFKRMIGNLLTNSVRHGGGKIFIETQFENQEIIISIRDNGPGIDEEKIPELFQPFARGDESRTTMGSGLGLAIVRRICDMHHGRIELANHEEGGLIARVVLPAMGALVKPENLSKGVR